MSKTPIITRLHNLKMHENGFRVVGPAAVCAEAGYSPLAVSGAWLLAHNGTRVKAFGPAESMDVCVLDSAPRCAVSDGDTITVMTAQGAWRISVDGEGRPAGAVGADVWPQVELAATPHDVFAEFVEAGAVDSLAGRVEAAYRNLSANIAGAGAYMQPVMAYAQLVGADGNVVHEYPPVLLMPDTVPFSETLETTVVNEQTMRMELSVASYRIKVSVPAGAASCGNVRLQVLATPQLHPFDATAGRATVSPVRNGAGVRVLLAASGHAVGTGRSYVTETNVLGVSGRLHGMARVVADMALPAGTATTTVVTCGPCGAPTHAQDLADVRRALSQPVTAVDSTLAALSVPHRFAAQAGAVNGHVTVWSGVQPVAFGGYGPWAWTQTYENRPWTGGVAVDFADGRRIVTPGSGLRTPLTLSPVLSYPAAHAVRLTLWWHAEGDTWPMWVSVPLQPDGSGRRAVYVSADAEAIVPHSAAFTVPQAVGSAATLAGDVSVAQQRGGGVLCAVRNTAPVMAVVAAPSAGGAWLFGRSRFYVFGTDGIRMLTIDKDGGSASLSMVDSRGCTHRHCASAAGNAVLAVAGQQLLRLTGNTVKTVCSCAAEVRVGWIAATDEAVLHEAYDNEARHMAAVPYTTTLEAAEGWLSAGGSVYAATAQGIANVGLRTAARTHVVWEAHMEGGRPRSVVWRMKGTGVEITARVLRAWLGGGDPFPRLMASVRVTGAVRAPLRLPVASRAAQQLVLSVQGEVNSDFILQNPVVQ